MSLRLYDSKSRTIRDFEPVAPGKASMYVCGITVQGPPHIGHLRAAVAFDVVRRWLARSGLDVTFVRNVTDIDDKILTKSAENDVDWWQWAYRNEVLCTQAYDALGVLAPSYEPRATGHVPEMIEMMQLLMDKGHAYAANGDVYFDVRSWAAYGELTGQKMDELQPAADTDSDERKRDPRDFALWKATKSAEPATASWPTPWGRGRPGWHLECSAMIRRYLGAEFDIHGGGIDLRFPHHENEQAQSTAAGDSFARFWMHNAWVTLAGEKMSKSLGNTLAFDALLGQARAVDLRFYLATVHYRSTIDFSDDSLAQARAAYERIENFIGRASSAGTDVDLAEVSLPEKFVASMNSDINVSEAMAVVYDAVREGNSLLTSDPTRAAELATSVRAMLDVLGLDPLDRHWAATAQPAPIDPLVDYLAQQRLSARTSKDFATADAIRDVLAASGITLEDTADGYSWSRT